MTEYPEMVKEAAEARIGADRMALGLPCIPDPLRGDMAEIERLRAALREIAGTQGTVLASTAVVMSEIARRALEPKP